MKTKRNKHRLTFRVPGVPLSKGSWRTMPHAVTGRQISLPDNPKLNVWQNRIALVAQTEWSGAPIDEAVYIELLFDFVRPKSVSAKKRQYPSVTPDLDKLERGVFDALEGIVYTQDSRIVSSAANKRYADTPGVTITVGTMAARSEESELTPLDAKPEES